MYVALHTAIALLYYVILGGPAIGQDNSAVDTILIGNATVNVSVNVGGFTQQSFMQFIRMARGIVVNDAPVTFVLGFYVNLVMGRWFKYLFSIRGPFDSLC